MVRTNFMELDKTIVDHGFIKDEIVDDDHYVLGGYGEEKLSGPVLMKNGHGWKKFRPAKEIQRRFGFETKNCTVFATLNALETLAAFHKFEDFPKDCSERYTGVVAETGPDGNSPHNVIEKIRNFGVIPQSVLPWTEDIDSFPEYYSPNPMDESMVALGQRILRKYRIGHKWVFSNVVKAKSRHGALIEALSVGTVCVSVRAWRKKNGRYWKNPGEDDNHWVMLLDYKQGEYWLVFDHYDDVLKKLEWDYDFERAKVYFIEKLPEGATWTPFSEPFDKAKAYFISLKSKIVKLWTSWN